MIISEKLLRLPPHTITEGIFQHLSDMVEMSLANGQVPIRFAVTETGNTHIICSVSILHTDYVNWTVENPSIFEFRKRPFEIVKDFNRSFSAYHYRRYFPTSE